MCTAPEGGYLETHPTITNAIGREITGVRRDVQMKDVFVALRRAGQIEQVRGKRGRATMWQKRSADPPVMLWSGDENPQS